MNFTKRNSFLQIGKFLCVILITAPYSIFPFASNHSNPQWRHCRQFYIIIRLWRGFVILADSAEENDLRLRGMTQKMILLQSRDFLPPLLRYAKTNMETQVEDLKVKIKVTRSYMAIILEVGPRGMVYESMTLPEPAPRHFPKKKDPKMVNRSRIMLKRLDLFEKFHKLHLPHTLFPSHPFHLRLPPHHPPRHHHRSLGLRLHRFFLRQNPLVAHKVTTVLTAIFQGSVYVLVFTNTSNFLGSLMSYVRDEDSAAILKLGAYVDSGDCRGGVAMKKSGKVQNDENLRIVHWPMAVPSLKKQFGIAAKFS
ncbi:hypothetical protein IGI04_002209 [Brassica rapa subsp. trilocularis]|uniref:Uncharacterized protein n=1 Tax=Brassica rapa subsp. trilocularis TaxID=1813537 RepID=A0ABQ7NUV1_BRACM|nr:hypothetical protein IGI04_002209 [Brassica rapa subsp. trilocularis]